MTDSEFREAVIEKLTMITTTQEHQSVDIKDIKENNKNQWIAINHNRVIVKVLSGIGSAVVTGVGGAILFFKDRIHDLW